MKPPRKQPKPPLINIPLGLIQWGDINNWTTYRTRTGKLVWFPKTWPKKPPSPSQATWREKFKQSINAWNALTPQQKQAYKRTIQKLSLCLTPTALKIAIDLDPTQTLKSTLERQSGEILT